MSSDPLVWQTLNLTRGTQAWQEQQELMRTAARELRDAGTAALPSSVQATAATFLERWSGYARESADIAQGFVGALEATADDYTRAEDDTDRSFRDIDSRLGPAR